ncbi:hypothetical protein ACJMK2_006277 [Sinanodonta woodiana]|uniref:Uncharacterized protein n=1 Tax=Sinanodonta woodiana TaxID=1069815 RepID=A0ABD3VSV7_SINWO
MRRWTVTLLLLAATPAKNEKLQLPAFQQLKDNYPGYLHHNGTYNNHQILKLIGCENNSKDLLIHDTSALRLSYSLNKIGGPHSLGKELIRLSKYGRDSVSGNGGLQYIYLPIAFGPFLADRYGYPTVSKLHQLDPVKTKENFFNKQGILRVITYTKTGNQPKGHVALWDCYHFHQSKDWIDDHSLLTVEFWESPDSNCTGRVTSQSETGQAAELPKPSLMELLQHPSFRRKYIKDHYDISKARHGKHKLRHQAQS